MKSGLNELLVLPENRIQLPNLTKLLIPNHEPVTNFRDPFKRETWTMKTTSLNPDS
jgi:hypothetical protein